MDLAGSERLAKSGVSGDRQKEALEPTIDALGWLVDDAYHDLIELAQSLLHIRWWSFVKLNVQIQVSMSRSGISLHCRICWRCGIGEVDKCAVPIPKCKVERLEKSLSEGFILKVSTANSLLIPIKTFSHETIVVLESRKTSKWFLDTSVHKEHKRLSFFLRKAAILGGNQD